MPFPGDPLFPEAGPMAPKAASCVLAASLAAWGWAVPFPWGVPMQIAGLGS